MGGGSGEGSDVGEALLDRVEAHAWRGDGRALQGEPWQPGRRPRMVELALLAQSPHRSIQDVNLRACEGTLACLPWLFFWNTEEHWAYRHL